MKNIITPLFFLVFTISSYGQIVTELNSNTPFFYLSGVEMTSKENNLVQRISVPKESIELVNFNPSLAFDSRKSIKELPVNIDGFSKLTVFSVFQPMANKEMVIWGNTQNGRKAFLSTHQMAGPAGVDSFKVVETGVPMISTVTQFWGNTSRGSAEANLTLGGFQNNENSIEYFEGFIPEILVYNRSLSKKEKEQIETKLALKYGITLKSIHYRSSSNKILWNYRENEEYHNRVAGIGRDDSCQLHQIKSKSTRKDAHLQVSLSKEGTFDNEQFLIWGDNNQPFIVAEKKNEEDGALYLQRQWKMEVNSTTEENLKTQLQIDFSHLNLPKGLLPYLVINENSDTKIQSQKSVFIPTSDIRAGNIAYFDFNKWDKDKSGSDYFTFAFKPETLDAKSLTIYPNPSESEVTIDIVLKDISDLQLKIHDANGKTLFSTEQDGQRFYQFKKTFSQNGIYLVEIRTKFGRLTKEFIIRKE